MGWQGIPFCWIFSPSFRRALKLNSIHDPAMSWSIIFCDVSSSKVLVSIRSWLSVKSQGMESCLFHQGTKASWSTKKLWNILWSKSCEEEYLPLQGPSLFSLPEPESCSPLVYQCHGWDHHWLLCSLAQCCPGRIIISGCFTSHLFWWCPWPWRSISSPGPSATIASLDTCR